MQENIKNNAKDYLKEFASKKAQWMQTLILSAIETNGNIPDWKFAEIVQGVISGECSVQSQVVEIEKKSQRTFQFVSLKHNSGVNAIRSGAEFLFSPNVTILYGLNGSGKSGYFRILNEIVGGRIQKEILSNIYQNVPSRVDVKIEYKYLNDNKDVNRTLDWNNTERGVSPFNACRVFDTSYLEGFLRVRNTDTTLLTPLSLHLFSYISACIDEIRSRIRKIADEKKNDKPTNINWQKFLGIKKTLFENNEHPRFHHDVDTFRELSVFTKEHATSLADLRKKRDGLQQANSAERIKSLQNLSADYSSLVQFINLSINKINEIVRTAMSAINDCRAKQIANDEAQKKFEIFASIPSVNSGEWKQFIEAGYKYVTINGIEGKRCPYCRQLLVAEARQLLDTYGQFLQSKTKSELRDAERHLDEIKTSIERVNIQRDLSKALTDDLEAIRVEDNMNAHDVVSKLQEKIKSAKDDVVSALSEKRPLEKLCLIIDEPILKILQGRIESIGKEIEILSSSQKEQQARLDELQSNISELEERESITAQKDDIENWFKIDDEIILLIRKADSVKTNEITSLANEAHEKLLTDKLKTVFCEELEKLGMSQIKVELRKRKASKGVVATEMHLVKDIDINKVLSEGEQKAAVLALFIAETRMQSVPAPIILDDPVTSLDHRIMANLAKRLIELDNQVIVFTHSKYFLAEFEIRGSHVCENHDGECKEKGKGKHVLMHYVDSLGSGETAASGVIFKCRGIKGPNIIKSIGAKFVAMESQPNLFSLRDLDGIALDLRQAIECLVEELIFFGEAPPKSIAGKGSIHWHKLRQLGIDDDDFNILKKHYEFLSDRGIHEGLGKFMNQLGMRELKKIYEDLVVVIGREQYKEKLNDKGNRKK